MISYVANNGMRIYKYNDIPLLAYVHINGNTHVVRPVIDGTLGELLAHHNFDKIHYSLSKDYLILHESGNGGLILLKMEVLEVLEKSIGIVEQLIRNYKRMLKISRSVPPDPITIRVGEHTIISHPGEYSYHDVLIFPNGKTVCLEYDVYEIYKGRDLRDKDITITNHNIKADGRCPRYFGKIDEETILADIVKYKEILNALKDIRSMECNILE